MIKRAPVKLQWLGRILLLWVIIVIKIPIKVHKIKDKLMMLNKIIWLLLMLEMKIIILLNK